MKFTTETKLLAEALKIAAVAAMDARSIPILGNVKIEVSDDQIVISTTNLDLYVIQKVPAKVSEPGAVTASFSILSQLINRLQSSETKIESGENQIEVESGEVLASLETLDADDFPLPLKVAAEGVKCDAGDLLKPFTALIHAISTDTSSYYLMGINVAGKELAASDRRRVASYRGDVELSSDSVILSDVFVRAVLKIQPQGEIRFVITEGNAILVGENIEIQSKLIEGNYPNWKQNVPQKNGKAFACDKKALVDALQTCSIFAGRQNQPGLVLTGKGKEIEVAMPGKARAMVLGNELCGQPKVSVRINERYLLDALNVVEKEDVRINVIDGHSPVLIEDGAFQSVIMIMRQ